MAKILLADDDLTILGFVQMVLETQDHHVVTARNGADALELFFEEAPDVVLLDVMMPQMNGMDVCEKIRAAAPLVPIILLTAKQQVQDVVNGLDSGADDYITKPLIAMSCWRVFRPPCGAVWPFANKPVQKPAICTWTA